MVDLSTDSLTNRWPHTLSSKAFFVTSVRGVRASAHKTANGLGASGTGCPARVRRASASSSSNRSKRSRRKASVEEGSEVTRVGMQSYFPSQKSQATPRREPRFDLDQTVASIL